MTHQESRTHCQSEVLTPSNDQKKTDMGGGSKKRKRTGGNVSPNSLCVGSTLAHLRGEPPVEDTAYIGGLLKGDDEPSDSGGWETVKRRKQNNRPCLKLSELHKLQHTVKLGDLQSLLLYCLADGPSPQWISVPHHHKVQKAVVLLVPGLEKGMFDGSVPLSEPESGAPYPLPNTDGG